MVDLKTFLDSVMPNQSCIDVTKLILSWFLYDIWVKKSQTFMIPIYSILNDTTITWFGHQIYVNDIDLFDAVDLYVTWSDKKGLIAHLQVLRYDGFKF